MPESYQHLLRPPLPHGAQALGWSHLHGAAPALALAEAAQLHPGVLVAVFEDQRQLQICENELQFFLGAGHAALVFPSWECLPYDVFSPHQDIISQRLRVLSSLPAMRRAVVLTTSANLMQRLPPPDYVLGHSFSLRRGQRIDLDALRAQLGDANYAAVQQVMSPGEFALRGGLIDIFPMGADAPFRLDLFDDEIETIRYFDPDTQRSRRDAEEISLLPAREFPMNESGIGRFRQAFRRLFEGDPRTQKIYTEISDGRVPGGAEFFLPLFFEETCTLFDYVRGEQLWLLPDGFDEGVKTQWAEIQDRYTNANYDSERRALPPQMLHIAPQELQQQLARHPRIRRVSAEAQSGWRAPCAPSMQFPVDAREESPYRHLLEHIERAENRLLLAVETAGRRESMEAMLANHGLRAAACDDFGAFVRDPAITLGLCVYPLERGLCLPGRGLEVISESQLYGEKVHRRRRAKAQDPEAVIRSLAELHLGDPVVHIEHGVGRYRGLQFLDIDGRATEFLALEYRDGDKLYVPVLALHLISRFVGGGKEHAPLHRLGGEQWQKARRRAREKAYDVAAELLEIEALRSARDGRAFVVPEEEYQGFVGRFAFEETPDQQRAILEVRADLESPEPMDRLVCGDVGFGKTEVALRAAFIAVHNDCQVAILTPTTLLAQQHHQTFTDRFADLSVTVEMLSRFKTKKQAAAIIAELKQGRPDIIIGTHRLLQEDVNFKRLGLLIIDEEHRFGVRQKEKIKQLRSQVDLLTLTATPIPRTLNLAMAGLRAISLIATAPELRLSIKTFICEWSRGLIREAVLREIRRGGQVYFLYNEVRSIERFTIELAELVPEAEVNFGHGRMGEARLERVMQDFYHRRFNVLVCSTIIESGIDIPSANTILIHRADRFGLAQLHQLRGRVGRSHHQAFAYLLIPERSALSRDAKKRLDAFGLMEDLGAGFALASHDLEIRGAGELLGETQSGLIDEVGFALYAEYLSMAVAAIKENRIAPADEIPAISSVDLHVPALFPPEYLANPHARLILYKRIAGAADRHELDELQVETADRFGLPPPPGRNLFRLTALRLRAERLGIHKIEIGEAGGVIEFADQPAVDPARVLAMVQRAPHEYRFKSPATLAITRDFSDAEARIGEVEQLLDELSADPAGDTLQ
ncbi:MAG: transcription-repair coupling factor [Gammaproteobacteria bacterium]